MIEQKIPKPAVKRLCALYQILLQVQKNDITNLSSSRIAQMMGDNSHSIRKDISYLGDIQSSGGGYDVDDLREKIAATFGFARQRLVCVVGLGSLGQSLLNFDQFEQSGYKIVAGFDSNINKVETIKSHIDLFASYSMAETIKRKKIELALLAVPAGAAQQTTEKLVAAGIRGIIDFAPIIVHSQSPHVFIENIDFLNELNILSAFIALNR